MHIVRSNTCLGISSLIFDLINRKFLFCRRLNYLIKFELSGSLPFFTECLNHISLTFSRIGEWSHPSQSLPRCGKSLQRGPHLPKVTNRVCWLVHTSHGTDWFLQPFQVSQGLEEVFRPRSTCVYQWTALLSMWRHGLCGAETANHCSGLLLWVKREAQLPHPTRRL